MRRVLVGALATVAAGLVGLGCGDDGDNVFLGGGELNNQDQFPGTSVATNNLAPDGAGLSPNNESLDDVRVIWSCDAPDSEGTFDGSNDAILLFTTTGSGVERVFASHYQAGSLTPPVELLAEDRDETTDVDLQAAVAVSLTTQRYQNSNGFTNAGSVQTNAGNWLILLPGTTAFEDPELRVREDVANLRGPHQTMWSYVWLRTLRGQALQTSDRVGGVPRSFMYGFQETGLEVPEIRGGATGAMNQAVPALACDVTSFGVVSDALAGQSDFGGTALPASDRLVPDGIASDRTDYRVAVPNTCAAMGGAAAELQPSRFAGGESMRFLSVFYTQVVNSMWGGPSVSSSDGSFSSGGEIQAFFASFDLELLAFESPVEVTMPAERNAAGGDTAAGTSPYPRFHTYNQFVFYKYVDMSLNGPFTPSGGSYQAGENPLLADGTTYSYDVANAVGHAGGDYRGDAMVEELCAYLTVVDDGDGTASIGVNQDLALHTSGAGVHDLVNPPVTGPNVGDVVNREVQQFNVQASGSKGAQFVFGADEGLADLVVFYASNDGVRDVSGEDPDENIDLALCAATVADSGAFVGGVGPAYVSAHEEDEDPNGEAGATPVLRDPLRGFVGGFQEIAWWFDAQINRTGEYVNVAYLQSLGTSVDFTRSVSALTYQTYRDTTNGGFAGPAQSARFAGPVRMDGTQTSLDPAFGMGTGEAGVPVNRFCWQDKLGYRGVQSDPEVMNLLWEQSDGLEDRLFAKRLTVTLGSNGTPSQDPGALGEFHEIPDVQANDAILGDGRVDATFRFIEGTVDLFGGVLSCDAGQDGDVLVVYGRIVDGTTNDGDDYDAAVFAGRYANGAINEIEEVSRRVDENQSLGAPVTLNGDFDLSAFDARPVALVATPRAALVTDAEVNRLYVYVLDARGTNGTSPTGLFARAYDAFARRSQTPPASFGLAFRPSADDAAPTAPIRLDNPQGSNVTSVDLCQSGTNVLLTFVQDAHVWSQLSSNGESYIESGGAPNPQLVDNDSSENVTVYALECCENGNGDAVDGILLFLKADASGDVRLRARAAVRLR